MCEINTRNTRIEQQIYFLIKFKKSFIAYLIYISSQINQVIPKKIYLLGLQLWRILFSQKFTPTRNRTWVKSPGSFYATATPLGSFKLFVFNALQYIRKAVSQFDYNHLFETLMRKDVEHISKIFFGHDAAFLIGFPALETVEQIVESKQQFFAEKVRPSINIFKLFPKQGLKPNTRLPNLLNESLSALAQQFEFDDEHETFTNKKKNMTSKTSSSDAEGQSVAKTPIYKLYSPANLVLKEQYTILIEDNFKKLGTKEEEQILKQRVKEWIQIGYHIHVVQAFKIENIAGNKIVIFLQKLKGRTLRDLHKQGFFKDKNKYLNSKRILNCILQIAIGLNYIHKRNVVHQQLIPQHIYIENQKILKIGGITGFNGVVGKIAKGAFVGGNPEYWSPEQGSIYDGISERAKQGAVSYHSVMKLIPAISNKSDLYQMGLLILEMMLGRRPWARGDKAFLKTIADLVSQSYCNKETAAFLFEKAEHFLRHKPEQRLSLYHFIVDLLTFYDANFRNAQDLLWCRFFDEEKYESELLNNKAVGLYLSGNETDCEKYWSRSLASNPFNLTAQYNFSHFKRMKRMIDDIKLNKDLAMQPENRKRNFYLLISNLVTLPLLREPFKTFNFTPKLSKHKEIQTLSNIIEALQKVKKDKDHIFQFRTHLRSFKFEDGHVVMIKDIKKETEQTKELPETGMKWFIGRVRHTNKFHCYFIEGDIKPYHYVQIICQKDAVPPDSRQAYSCVDPSHRYLAASENSYLSIFNIEKLNQEQFEVFHEIKDYGSSITTLQFDVRSQILGIGSNQFTIKLFNMLTKQIHKVINIGQKFIIKNLQYYDRNTCISYSYEKAVSFHRIQTTKNLFTIRCNAAVLGYRILEISNTSHLMIVHTSEKFEVWSLKDKNLIRNIEIDEAPKIQGFFANSQKKIVVHFTKNQIRLWSYTNGLILKTFRTPIPLVWLHVSEDAKYVRSLDSEGNFVTRFIDFGEFIKSFEGICVPNEINLAEQQEYGDQITQYLKLGRELVENLNDYRLNEQEKKVSLEKMYKLAQTIKNTFFFQDKEDIKTIFQYLNGIRQAEDRSSRINSHSQQYIFMSRKEQFITATSNYNEGHWLIGEQSGNIRMVAAPDKLILSLRPKQAPVTFLYLQPTSFFIAYSTTCLLVERESLNIIVTHTSYHKKPIRMGLVINTILATGDEEQLILFWNKDKVRRYNISVNIGEVVGNKLIIAGFDNRIRLYEIDPEEGAKKTHVFIGHTLSIYNMVPIDDSIFTTYSFDGTIRWWNTQVKACFSYFNFKKYFKNEKVLWVDMPKFSLEDQVHAKFDREGCALVLLNAGQVVVFDTMRKQVKWRLQLMDEVVKVFWTNYPNTFAAVTHEQVKVMSIYWRFMVLKK